MNAAMTYDHVAALRDQFDMGIIKPDWPVIYIAGPMTGFRDYNFPAFFEAAARFRLRGWKVISPAEHDIEAGWVVVEWDGWGGILSATKREEGAFNWEKALDWDIEALKTCDAIYMLPGWSKSRGACKEYAFARSRNLDIYGAVEETPVAVFDTLPLVGLIGLAQAGKDSVAGFLGYRRLAFADPLKAVALACDPRFQHEHGWWNLSELVFSFGWEYAKNKVPGVREFLQRLGTEGVRVNLGNDIWVEAAFKAYDPTQATVFTDVRFPNEVEAIRGRGGKIVRVTKIGQVPAGNHVSEQLAVTEKADYEIVAEPGDMASLEAQTKALAGQLDGRRGWEVTN
jgi:hypothetical protein